MIDLTSQRFGRLLVMHEGERISRHRHWLCQCDCGSTSLVRQQYLTGGNTQSCGCLQRERASAWRTQANLARKTTNHE